VKKTLDTGSTVYPTVVANQEWYLTLFLTPLSFQEWDNSKLTARAASGGREFHRGTRVGKKLYL
jgi:hypothetical protein